MTARKGASRREILKVVSAGGAGLTIAPLLVVKAVGSSRIVARKPAALRPSGVQPKKPAEAAATPAPKPAQVVSADAKGYLADLVGKRVDEYRVESVGALDRGGIPVEMRAPSGARFRVDVLRFDPREGTRGIGELSAVTVYLCNGGKGRKATDEELGLGAMALAGELARRERAGRLPPRGLLTMAQRAAQDDSPLAPSAASFT